MRCRTSDCFAELIFTPPVWGLKAHVFINEYLFHGRSNEPVGKVLLISETGVFGGLLTHPKHEVVDCGAIYEVTFFCISPKNLLGDFFYRHNARINQRPIYSRLAASMWLGVLFPPSEALTWYLLDDFII